MPTIEFFYDFSSPYSYLASERIREVAARTGAAFAPKPFVLAAVFKATNPGRNFVPAQLAHLGRDVTAWADHLGIAFAFPSQFPVNAMRAHRLVLGVDDADAAWRLAGRIFRAMWAEGRDITSDEVLAQLAAAEGLDAAALLEKSEQPEIKARLREYTDDAIARGAFGAPTMFVGDQMFFGNDRLHFVERAANGERVYRD